MLNETAEAAQKVAEAAKSDLASVAGKMATSATSQIADAAGSLANAGSKWAYVWMVQRIFDSILTTLLLGVIVIGVIYVIMFFMRRFITMFRETMKSTEFVSRVARNIKSQIAIDNTTLIEDVGRHKDDIHEKVVMLTNKVKHFAEIQSKYEFEPLKKQLQDVLDEYRAALKTYESRLARLELEVMRIRESKSKE